MSALQEVDHESADCFEIRRLHLYLFFQPSDRKYNGKKAETALSFLSGNDRCFFKCLEKEMIHYRLILPQALEKASSCCRAGPEKLFAYASTHFSKYGGSFQKLWQEAIRQCVPPALFSEEELCLFLEISGALCSSDAVLQKTRFDAYRTQFEQLENDAKEIWKGKSTLYRKLSAAAGVFFILLLL